MSRVASKRLIPRQPDLVSALHFLSAHAGSEMTLRMERFSLRHGTRIRLSGELRNEQLNDLRTEIERGGQPVTLDLGELNLVDVDAVRFLNACCAQGARVVNRSLYIREWMRRERKQKQDGRVRQCQ